MKTDLLLPAKQLKRKEQLTKMVMSVTCSWDGFTALSPNIWIWIARSFFAMSLQTSSWTLVIRWGALHFQAQPQQTYYIALWLQERNTDIVNVGFSFCNHTVKHFLTLLTPTSFSINFSYHYQVLYFSSFHHASKEGCLPLNYFIN